MRIYTRQGDKGLTRLADGSSLAKDDRRVETYGAIDELNSQIGLLMAEIPENEPALLAELILLQQELFDLGGELAFSSEAQNASLWQVNEAWTARLEQQIDAYSAQLPTAYQPSNRTGFVAPASASWAQASQLVANA